MMMAPPHIADRGRRETRVPRDTPAADAAGMHNVTPLTGRPSAPTMRCECASCGAHVTVRRSWQLAGQCGNCRSYELRPLARPALPEVQAA